MTELQTAIFYLALIVVCSLLAHSSDRSGKKSGIALAAVALIIVSGFRGYEVGTDTLSYKEGIDFFFFNGTQHWSHTFSDGYGWFTKSVLTIWNNYTFLLVIQATITCGLFVMRLWDFRKSCSLGFAMFVYSVTVFPLTLCLICQCLAVSILFYGSRYLDNGKPLSYFIFLVIASLIHTSALIGICSFALYIWKIKCLTKAQLLVKILAYLALLAAGFASAYILIDRYAGYSDNASDLGLMAFIQLFVLLSSLLLSGRFSCRDMRLTMSKNAGIALPQYIFGILLTTSSYIIANAGRIAYYYTINSTVVFGFLVKDSGSSKQVFVLAVFLVAWFLLYGWYSYLFHTSLGIECYSFIWV